MSSYYTGTKCDNNELQLISRQVGHLNDMNIRTLVGLSDTYSRLTDINLDFSFLIFAQET